MRCCAPDADVTFQHRHQPITVGRIAGFDDKVEHQAASAGGQIECVGASKDVECLRPLTRHGVSVAAAV